MDIFGQDILLSKINNCNLDNFPKSLMLIGDYGSGKHLMTEYIANHLNIELQDITELLSLELITDIYTRSNPILYTIDSDKMSIKEQNMILKFLEEPLKNSYIIILVENINKILPTIKNRCQLWQLQLYEFNQLAKIYSIEDTSVNRYIFNTPGKIQKYKGVDLNSIYQFCYKIFTKIGNANFSNSLTIVDKISFEEENTDKIDYKLFINILQFTIIEIILNDNNIIFQKMYDETNKLLNTTFQKLVDNKVLFENYLINLRFIARGEK